MSICMAKLCKLMNYCKNYCIKSVHTQFQSVLEIIHRFSGGNLLLDEETPLLPVSSQVSLVFSFSRLDFMMHRVEIMFGMVSRFLGRSDNNTACHAARTLHLQ